MDRKEFEKDLLELLKKHGFQSENVRKIRIETDIEGSCLVNIEVMAN